MRLTIDNQEVEGRPGEDVLTAWARHGRLPPGCLCLAGDCPNCLATVDGVAYHRMCQTMVRDGMEVSPFRVQDHPSMPDAPITTGDRHHRHEHVDTVVIGGGRSGTAEAERRTSDDEVVVIDATRGDEALALYAGPEVVARLAGSIVRLHANDVVVATGAVDLQPVCPGSELEGILTPGAATKLAAAGVDLGDLLWVGDRPPGDVPARNVSGSVVRFEGVERVSAVVVRDADGKEERYSCDTVTADLGTYPRDTLARMAPEGQVRVVGSAASEPTIPPCPAEGTICPCSEVTVADLDRVWERGFHELELLKRATLAGTGTCQGGVCGPYLQSFVADRGGEVQPKFTARPLARQMTVAEAAAGVRMPPIHRSSLDQVHRRLGARMDRVGGWLRPWTYGNTDREYEAVRSAVSLGDVGTLGKVLVAGPDSAAFLEQIYPCRVADIRPGRSRYALVLGESGGLLDDGLISRIDENRFALTFTSGGASFAEAWLRDWAVAFDADVRIMDRTHSLGAINVTGPAASELLARAGLGDPITFMSHAERSVAGIDCRVFRLSFTGEVSYELHHPVSRSEELWSELMRLGSDLDVHPHGLLTLQTLRLEKGHVIVGMDTEPDSTPRRLGMEWAVKMDKPDFIGKAALARTGRLPLDRRLVGLTMGAPAPVDGSPIYHRDRDQIGYVTSAAWSSVLSTAVMLGWVDLDDGAIPEEVTIDGRPARHASLPFYDPDGSRARA